MCSTAPSNLLNVEEVNVGDNVIRIINTDVRKIFYVEDICKILGIKQARKTMMNFTEEELVSVELRQKYNIVTYKKYKNGLRKDNKITLLTELGAKRLICNSRSIRANELAKLLNIDIYTRYEPIESETIRKIVTVFASHKPETQKIVGDYRVDLYFPDVKLAVECDENGHQDRDLIYEIKRQNTITRELQCTFIRYNPDSPGFDIFNIIAKIHNIFMRTHTHTHTHT